MERQKRQHEIAEMAQNENKDQNEIQMQEKFLVQRLYSAFLRKKMEQEMKKNYSIEDAFQKIRTATNLSNVNEIVHRFLTREQTYSELLNAVSVHERKIENLRKDHETWGTKLHELQISDKDNAKNEEEPEVDEDTEQRAHKYLSPEIEQLDKHIQQLTKEKEKTDELRKKVNLVYDQVQGWSSKVIAKIDQQFGENITAYETSKTLAFLFEKIAEAVCKQLGQIIAEEDDEERGYITAKDFMNDFCTQEFLDKNIRVRPVSGMSKGPGDDGKTNDPYAKSLNDPYNDKMDDLEKTIQNQLLEMEDQRVEIKKNYEAYLQRKRLEEEKAKKKR